jgi:hypothetical protein
MHDQDGIWDGVGRSAERWAFGYVSGSAKSGVVVSGWIRIVKSGPFWFFGGRW